MCRIDPSQLQSARHHQGCISDDTKRIILSGVLHGVQSRLQQTIGSEIESISESISVLPRGSDDVSLYHLAGWALLSVIKCRKELKQSLGKLELQQELMLLQLLTISKEEKINLPATVRYLDRGRVTFPQPRSIPFLRAVEDRMLEILNENKILFEVATSFPQTYPSTQSYPLSFRACRSQRPLFWKTRVFSKPFQKLLVKESRQITRKLKLQRESILLYTDNPTMIEEGTLLFSLAGVSAMAAGGENLSQICPEVHD